MTSLHDISTWKIRKLLIGTDDKPSFAALATLQGMEPPGTRLTYIHTVESGCAARDLET